MPSTSSISLSRRAQPVLAEKVRVQVRQLDRVADLLDVPQDHAGLDHAQHQAGRADLEWLRS
jgi:hypothetical protein